MFGPIVWIGINDWSVFGARTWIEDDLTENHAGEIAVTREDIIDTSGIGAIQDGYTDRAVLIRDGRLLAQRSSGSVWTSAYASTKSEARML